MSNNDEIIDRVDALEFYRLSTALNAAVKYASESGISPNFSISALEVEVMKIRHPELIEEARKRVTEHWEGEGD